MYDWLLFLHVLSAFLLVGALTYFWALVLATRPGRAMFPGSTAVALARPASIAVIAGVAGTLIFGVWLAIYVDGYELWDGWILAALVLWAVAAETGRRGSRADAQARETALQRAGGTDGPATARGDAVARDRRAMAVHLVYAASVVAILALMIFKPGGA